MEAVKCVKTYDGVNEVEAGKREVVSVINTEAIDRDGEVVKPGGMKKKNYQGNPVVFYSHDYTQPVGKSLWVKSGQDGNGNDVLIAKTYFSDKTELARDIFGLIQDKVLNAFSIGFQSLRSSPPSTKEINIRPDLKNAKLIHRDWELLEYSVVGVPCNPEALSLAVSKGYSQATIDLIGGKAQNTEATTKAIVEDVEAEPVRSFTELDLKKFIIKRLDRVTVSIDADKVFADAMKMVCK